MNDRYFGAHVSSSGGLENALRNGESLSVNTIQIHPSPPQRWNSKPFPAGVERGFLERQAKTSCVEKVFFHAIYLINLASPDRQQQHLSKLSLVHCLELAERMNADGVIFHVGSLKDEADEATGLNRAGEAINWILENAPGTSRLLLEVAAGGGKVIGDRLEELRQIYDVVDRKERTGFALDTQHLWASGYNLATGLDEFVASVERVFGLEKVWAIHLNDSKTELGSRRDRHENIGDGTIGSPALKAFFLHPKLAAIPFILETPHLKSLETASLEIEKLRAFLAPEARSCVNHIG